MTSQFHDSGLTTLKALDDVEIIYENWRETGILYFDEDELIEKLNSLEVDIFVTEADEVDTKVIKNTHLKLIASTRGTPVNVDAETAKMRGIPVIYTPHRNADAVADLTVAMMLTQARKMIEIDRFLRKGDFDVSDLDEDEFTGFFNKFIGVELGNLTIGIVGFGEIGQRVAKRLHNGFGSKILYFDPFVSTDHPVVKMTRATSVSLELLMQESDMITIHTPPIEDTEELINAKMIELMKPTAHFFNLARSYCIKEDALYDAIKEKKIAGAGLDVFDDEPVDSENRFLEFENVTVMPHFGGNTKDVIKHQTDMIVSDIINFLEDKPLKYLWEE